MLAHRALGDAEPAGDAQVGPPGGGEGQHLALASGGTVRGAEGRHGLVDQIDSAARQRRSLTAQRRRRLVERGPEGQCRPQRALDRLQQVQVLRPEVDSGPVCTEEHDVGRGACAA